MKEEEEEEEEGEEEGEGEGEGSSKHRASLNSCVSLPGLSQNVSWRSISAPFVDQ